MQQKSTKGKLIGSCVFAQSGGPTAVINSSCAGVVYEALNQDCITEVYSAFNGINGILNENFYKFSKDDFEEIQALKYTPSSAFGSVRYKLKDFNEDDTDYKRILEVFKKLNVRYFFYNGGNDSMDTCNKISKFMLQNGYEIRVVGIPKTIDNDLAITDHCPGYGSACKYIATSISEIYKDLQIYQSPLCIIVEVMGRNAGWLTASARLSELCGCKTDLIYLPEITFDKDKFINDVNAIINKKGKCLIAVSEGIKFSDGSYVGERKDLTDVFGHSQLGGVGAYLKEVVTKNCKVKCKSVELNILQRCASHIASQTDIEETYEAGKQGVKKAVKGETDIMVAYKRISDNPYKIKYESVNLTEVANAEKVIPKEWITETGTYLNENFVNYALPLIQGKTKQKEYMGLPVYSKLGERNK